MKSNEESPMRYVFVTGGVVSSLGKGLVAASLGALLEQHNLSVVLQKFDPYLNVDPGTMSPLEHGEVYVLDDGAETDLDLGHYERFTNVTLRRQNSVSSGQIYETILRKERRGEYLGEDVQVIPHVTDEIKRRIKMGGQPGTDVVITEIGGVVGDIEGLPFLEALRQLALEVGPKNVLFVHVTLIIYLQAASELKTKPTQQSVAKLREIGIQPNILICRTQKSIDTDIRRKLSLFCNVPPHCVIEEKDVEHSVYELPWKLHREGLDRLVLEHFGLPSIEPFSVTFWDEFIDRIRHPKCSVRIAVVGKYTGIKDTYKSISEAFVHAGVVHQCHVETVFVDSEGIRPEVESDELAGVHGILVPGGFGERGVEGKVEAVRWAREKGIPFLGICLGMQMAVVEFARHVAGLERANSTEFDKETPCPVVDILDQQRSVTQKGGTMRLGSYECVLTKDSRAFDAYGRTEIAERHRHRYEFNDRFAESLGGLGLKIVGRERRSGMVEVVEIQNHPWFVAVQFHPEFKSKPTSPHPLFEAFVRACLEFKS
jgi:CTP synthase